MWHTAELILSAHIVTMQFTLRLPSPTLLQLHTLARCPSLLSSHRICSRTNSTRSLPHSSTSSKASVPVVPTHTRRCLVTPLCTLVLRTHRPLVVPTIPTPPNEETLPAARAGVDTSLRITSTRGHRLERIPLCLSSLSIYTRQSPI